MKIIFGEDKFETERHARGLIKAIDKVDMQHPHRVNPKGVAVHLARFTYTCDECGQSYWAVHEWAAHTGCPGSPEKQDRSFGFSS